MDHRHILDGAANRLIWLYVQCTLITCQPHSCNLMSIIYQDESHYCYSYMQVRLLKLNTIGDMRRTGKQGG